MKARLGLLLTTYYSAWTGATVSPLPGSLSPIAPFRWLGKWWKIVMVMIRLSDGFQPERKHSCMWDSIIFFVFHVKLRMG